MHWTRQFLMTLVVAATCGYLSARFVTPVVFKVPEAHPDYRVPQKARAVVTKLVGDAEPGLTDCERYSVLSAWASNQTGQLSDEQLTEFCRLIVWGAALRVLRDDHAQGGDMLERMLTRMRKERGI
jgi:hypothetical protein